MPAADLRERQVLLDPLRGVDEIHGVVVVLLHAGADGQDVRVENDVLRREADLLRQNAVGALAHLGLALEGIGLALLVEGHHDDGRAIAANQHGLLHELLLAFLEADGVDHAFALDALQPGLDDRPLASCQS